EGVGSLAKLGAEIHARTGDVAEHRGQGVVALAAVEINLQSAAADSWRKIERGGIISGSHVDLEMQGRRQRIGQRVSEGIVTAPRMDHHVIDGRACSGLAVNRAGNGAVATVRY